MPIQMLFKILVLIGMTGFFAGCAISTQKDHAERNKHISMAALLGEENLTDAQRLAKSDQYISTAEAALEDRDFSQAKRSVSQALRLQPNRMDGHIIFAEVDLGQGKHEAAFERFEKINEISPSIAALQGMGLAKLNMGNYQAARKYLEQALELDSTMWRALNGIGVSYAVSKQWDEAEQAYQKALSLNAESPQIYNNLGLSYLHRGQYELALKTLSHALAQPHGETVAGENYRWAQALNGQMDQAMVGLDDISRAVLFNNLGQSALNSGDYRKAVSYFETALKTHPNYYVQAEQNLQIAKQQFN